MTGTTRGSFGGEGVRGSRCGGLCDGEGRPLPAGHGRAAYVERLRSAERLAEAAWSRLIDRLHEAGEGAGACDLDRGAVGFLLAEACDRAPDEQAGHIEADASLVVSRWGCSVLWGAGLDNEPEYAREVDAAEAFGGFVETLAEVYGEQLARGEGLPSYFTEPTARAAAAAAFKVERR